MLFRRRSRLFILTVFMVISMMRISAFADVTASHVIASGSKAHVEVANTAGENAVGQGNIADILSVSAYDDVINFHGDRYENLDPDEKEAYMLAALSSIKSSNLGAKEKNSIYNFIASQDNEVTQALKYLTEDTRSDLASARKWLAPFTGGISTFTGILSVLVFLFLGVGILMDVAYLALPGLQLILERGDDKKKPFGVSIEAWKINREVAMDYKNSKNEITEYLKKRVPVILVCAICIGYLISGQIYDIFSHIANAFSNI